MCNVRDEYRRLNAVASFAERWRSLRLKITHRKGVYTKPGYALLISGLCPSLRFQYLPPSAQGMRNVHDEYRRLNAVASFAKPWRSLRLKITHRKGVYTKPGYALFISGLCLSLRFQYLPPSAQGMRNVRDEDGRIFLNNPESFFLSSLNKQQTDIL
ncbi:MAG: hypothetical protein J7599_20935 [Niabella sp.]|nr:hypothetical protein [Niabella sp.]